jgi:hypothetical protein
MGKEKQKAGSSSGKKKARNYKEPIKSKDKPGSNYWDSVADDVASGYTTKNDESPILNIDQKPGDDERADEIGTGIL